MRTPRIRFRQNVLQNSLPMEAILRNRCVCVRVRQKCRPCTWDIGRYLLIVYFAARGDVRAGVALFSLEEGVLARESLSVSTDSSAVCLDCRRSRLLSTGASRLPLTPDHGLLFVLMLIVHISNDLILGRASILSG